MNSITKYLLGSLAAILLCAGEAALFAADTAAAAPARSITVGFADLDLEQAALPRSTAGSLPPPAAPAAPAS